MGATSTGGGFISSSAQIGDDVILNSDIADESITSSKLKGEGTAAWVLTSNGTGSSPSMQVIPSATGANYAFLETITLGSDESTIVSSSIGTATYGGFLVMYNVAAVGNMSTIGFILNSDNTASHYSSDRLSLVTTTISAAVRTQPLFEVQAQSNLTANDSAIGTLIITNPASGSYRGMSSTGAVTNSTPTALQMHTNTGVWVGTTDVTNITMTCGAGTYKSGSSISIWGMKIV